MSAKTLLRRTLIFGETGSGKTASGILSIIHAAFAAMEGNEPDRIGCLLVVDPKQDIAPVFRTTNNVDGDQSERIGAA